MQPDCTKEELEIWQELKKKPHTRPVDIAKVIGRKATYVQNVMGRLLHKDLVTRDKRGYQVKDIESAKMIRDFLQRKWT